jgi:hypothetical protein
MNSYAVRKNQNWNPSSCEERTKFILSAVREQITKFLQLLKLLRACEL